MTGMSVADLAMHILEVEITSRCNLNCRHCYNRNKKAVDMPLKYFKEFYNFANKYNVWTFTVSGGEALLHPQFDEIISYIKKTRHNFRLVLQTNGTLINDEIVNKIKVFDLIHVSFDQLDDLRKNGQRNLELAKNLIDRGLKSYLFVTIHKKNKDLIEEMVIASNKEKVPIGFNICIPTEKLDKEYLLSRSEFMRVEKKLFEYYKEGKILRYSSPLVSLLDKSKSGSWQGVRGGCSAGIAACVIDPAGNLFPCPFFRLSAGSVYEKSLKDLWLNADLFNKIRNRKEYKEPCDKCSFLSYCGGCRKRAYFQDGNVQDNDPFCYKDLL